jgi:hypothetical protein
LVFLFIFITDFIDGETELPKKVDTNQINKVLKMDLDELCNLITDSTGNYIVQEVFKDKVCSPEQRMEIMEKISTKVVELSCHKKGTHCIQTLVTTLKTDDEVNLFLGMIKGKEHNLYSNPYGTFVLQKVVDHFPEHLQEPIKSICIENFMKMATSNNGLPIIKKAIAKFKNSKDQFVKIIVEHTMTLAQHPFGNYAIQVAIENWDESECQEIFNIVISNLQQLSMQKISSNVVEKFLDKACQETINYSLKLINNKEFMKMLIRNMYGFFVVERALMRSDDEEMKREIAIEISANIKSLSDKSLKRKWIKLYSS